jgi:hypothetical protein
MMARPEVKLAAWAIVAVLVGIGGFFAGGAIHGDEEPPFVFDTNAPAFDADFHALAVTSPGGFTGFEDLLAGGSRTVLGGRIVEISSTEMTLEGSTGAQTTLRLDGEPAIGLIESGGRELLLPGATVLVRLDETEQMAAAVLVVTEP